MVCVSGLKKKKKAIPSKAETSCVHGACNNLKNRNIGNEESFYLSS